MIYRGTHTYNSKEMSVFIDGLVQEAKQLDIASISSISQSLGTSLSISKVKTTLPLICFSFSSNGSG